MTGAAMVVTVWAFSKLLGLPDLVMYGVMALGAIPVLWLTFWTAGRAWQVERRLARGQGCRHARLQARTLLQEG